MAVYIFKLLLLQTIVFGFSYGSTINFNSSPDTIQPSLTSTLTLVCEVNNTVRNSPNGQLIGRDVTSTADDLLVLTSIVIVRNGNVDVAKVTIVTQAEALVDLNNIEVNGSLTRNNGVSGFLKLTWDFPTSAQIGDYSCEASGVDAQGHNVVLKEATTVNKVQPTIDDLVSHILNLTLDVRGQQATIHNLRNDYQNEISDLKNVNQNQQNMLTELQRNASALVTRLTHTETGITLVGYNSFYRWALDVNNQRTKTTNVQFAKPYTQAPVVHLATKKLEIRSVDNFFYDMELVSVTTTGFVFNCKGYNSPTWNINDLWVSWLSVPQ